MAVIVKKIKTYYCGGLVDGWADVKDNGEIEVYGFGYSKYTINQIKDLSLFLQFVYDDNAIHEQFAEEREETPWVKSYCGGRPSYCTPEETPEETPEA